MAGYFHFHPVGQGLFYTGVIRRGNESFIFVYDCGGSGKDLVASVVKRFIDSLRGKKIDLLVLSHLHEDHINGIESILKELEPGGNIVIPYVDRHLQLLYQYHYRRQHPNPGDRDQFIVDFYDDPVGKISDMTDSRVSINMVSSFPLDDDFDSDTYSLDRDQKEVESKKTISLHKKGGKGSQCTIHLSSGYEQILQDFDWQLRITQPFFDRETYKKYRGYLGGNRSLADLLMDSDARSHLKQLNNAQNKSCLLLEHWPQSSNSVSRSVLTGDLPETETRMIRDVLSSQGKNHVYLIPHHGSKSSEPSVTDSDISVVSYGTNNSHKHPDRNTLNIYGRNSSVIEVNETGNGYSYKV